MMDLGNLEPAAIRLTLERLQESAGRSGCFLLVGRSGSACSDSPLRCFAVVYGFLTHDHKHAFN